MNRVYFYLDGSDQKGPLAVDQLKSVGITPDTLIWAEGFENWKPAKDVDELSILIRETTPPPPPIATPVPPPPEKEKEKEKPSLCPFCNKKNPENVDECTHCGEWINDKKCPFCKEEIEKDAAKCKHCGEWLIEEEKIGIGGKIGITIVLLALSGALFFFGSWKWNSGIEIDWVEKHFGMTRSELEQSSRYAVWQESFIVLEKYRLLVRNDGKYHGLVNDTRFFDLPIVSWIMLGLSVLALVSIYYVVIDRD